MAEQVEAWPQGLQPINATVGLAINRDFFRSISFNTLLSGSPTCSTDSSSDLDTESTGSFFHDKSITLGSLIGVSSIVDLSRRSLRVRKSEPSKEKTKTNNNNKNSKKSKTWCFTWCASNGSIDTESPKPGPSLGHFLEVERKAANGCRRNHIGPEIYGPDELALAQPHSEPNSLFINGFIAPPRSNTYSDTDKDRRETSGGDKGYGSGICLRFSLCICGQHFSD